MNYKEAEPLKDHTTFKAGGPARFFVSVTSLEELIEAITFAKQKSLPWYVLGGGSNTLFSEEGFPGVVIQIAIKGIKESPVREVVTLTAAAGELFDDVVTHAVAKGYWGIENLSHIPGSVGAAPIQNIGAYGVEVEQVIDSVQVLDPDTLVVRKFSKTECQFGYRDSIFKQSSTKQLIVVAVTFSLHKNPNPILEYRDLKEYFAASNVTPSLKNIREAVIYIRSRKFPDWHKVGTAGSFFKNPIIPKTQYEVLLQQYPTLPSYPVSDTTVKIPLGYVIDKICGLRGVSDGVVGSYEGQALVVINQGGTSTDILKFTKHIADQVKKKTLIEIEPEVTIL